jgi:hypothetical protein
MIRTSHRDLLVRLWPHLLALLLFAIVSCAFYAKQYDGYSLRQHDIIQYRGMSKELNDASILNTQEQEAFGWTGSMFGGMPTDQIQKESSGFSFTKEMTRWVYRVFNSFSSASLWLSMLAAYLLAIALGAHPLIAITCGLAYGLSTVGIMYIGAGHNTKVRAIAFMPGVMAGVMWAFRRNRWAGGAIAGLFTALIVAAGHPQMVYYLLFLMVAVGITEVIGLTHGKKNWNEIFKIIAFLAVAGIVGVLPSASGLLETKTYSEYTMRGDKLLSSDSEGAEFENEEGLATDYILEYSMAGGEWWAIMCPDFKGGGNQMYWGEQRYSAGPFYFGAVACLFFVLFLFVGRDRLKWPLLIIAILAIILSKRELTGIMEFFIEWVPFFKQFRDTKMMLILIQVSVVIGLALGLGELLQLSKSSGAARDKALRRWAVGFGAFMALFGLFYAFPESIFDFQPFLRDDFAAEQLGLQQAIGLRVELFRADVLRTMGLWLIAGSLVFVWMIGWVKSVPILLAICSLVVGEMWSVNRRYANDDKLPGGGYVSWVKNIDAAFPFVAPPTMRAALDLELQNHPDLGEDVDKLFDSYKRRFKGSRLTRSDNERLREVAQFGALRFADHYRVLRWGALWNESETSYFFQSIGGYHGAKLRRYADFIHEVLVEEIVKFGEGARNGTVAEGLEQFVCVKMLNVKYVFVDDNSMPILIPDRSGVGWVASAWSYVESSNEEMDGIKALSSYDECVIDEEFRVNMEGLSPGAQGFVEMTSYGLENMEYDVTVDTDALVVFFRGMVSCGLGGSSGW